MSLIKYLGNLGYGSRRQVAALVSSRRVSLSDGRILAASDRWLHSDLRVDGEPLDPAPGAVILLHKPTGYICSTQDVPPLIYDLLPARFLRRAPVMASVGRLDRDTSGLLLLTDDGALNHRLTSPRSHLPKTYRLTLAHPLNGSEADAFSAGTLRLSGEDTPLLSAALTVLGAQSAELTIHEGRYHQVRRMFAAVGNHVVTLHRVAIGALTLRDVDEGTWRILTDQERGMLPG